MLTGVNAWPRASNTISVSKKGESIVRGTLAVAIAPLVSIGVALGFVLSVAGGWTRGRRRWWRLPGDDLSRMFVRRGMPPTLFGFVRRVSASSQVWISLLAIAVFILNTAPLELQRRILNAAVLDGAIERVVALGFVYAAIVLAEGLLKLLLNVYGGWIGEKAVRALRLAASGVVRAMARRRADPGVQGVEISLMLAEPEPIGGFVGIAVSELVLQIGILQSVFGYMIYMQPQLALVCLLVALPQFVFVPLMQLAINRKVQSRIIVLRKVSAGVLREEPSEADRAHEQKLRFAEIFYLNLGIIKLRFSMKFLMNFTQNAGKIDVLVVGGWFVIEGRTDVGTVVAFVSGLNNVRDPWSDLVNWYQDMMLNSAKYQTFVGAMQRFANDEEPLPSRERG
jgi:ABC-type bacteriocin/lantibiotic exporter with double-glycine peptidase domain